MKPRTLYGVSFGAWVEVREGTRAPRPRVSEAEVPVKVPDLNAAPDFSVYPYRYPLKDARAKISQITFRGGRVIGCLRRNSFTHLTGLSLKKGVCVQIPEESVQKLLIKLGHKEP